MKRLLASILIICFCCCGFAQLPAGFQDVAYVTGLTQPVAIAFAPDGRLFVAEKTGAIKVVQAGAVVSTFATLNVSTYNERGLLGIALDPDFPNRPYVYIYYTTTSTSLNPPPTPKNRVSRLTANGNFAVGGSETILLDNIASDAGNHNGGCIRFAPDGTLYIGTGDGGSTPSNGQSLLTLSGKILRINADGSIPTDNPFYGSLSAYNEIFAYGFRNPFRFSIRPGTSTLYIGDVGANAWEEVNVGAAHGNYGWNTYEGPTNVAGYISPVFAYPHTSTQSGCITGGCFVVGKRFPPAFNGLYFYGDYVRNVIRTVQFTADNKYVADADFEAASGPVDFLEGADGSLYYVSLNDGSVRRISYRTSFTGMSVSPSSVMGGKGTRATVTLDNPAPAAGALILLSADSGLSVPASIRIPGGAVSASFAVGSSVRTNLATLGVRGTRNGITKSTSVKVYPTSDAYPLQQTVPSFMTAGQKYAVTVTMHNAGPSAWTYDAGYRLLSYNPSGNKTWGFDRMYIPSGVTVLSGQDYTFTATVTAPAVPGTYNFQWKMLLSGLGTFGQPSPNVVVTVN